MIRYLKYHFKRWYYGSLPKHAILRCGDRWLYIDPMGDVYRLTATYNEQGSPLIIELMWRR